MRNYLVSVFMGGKNVYSYYSDTLDELVTIHALYRGGEISIFDLRSLVSLTAKQVRNEIHKSGMRWKRSLERVVEDEVISPPVVACKPIKKRWERCVRCVETGQVFSSIRECSKAVGIPYMTIVNCIKRKNATRGLHFENYIPVNDDENT